METLHTWRGPSWPARLRSGQSAVMTRSADAALDEAQLKLGNACEELLASKAWQRSHPETYSGLKLRLQLLQEAGLPRMRVVPNTKLEELGRIPRSNEGHQVDALEAVKKLGKVPVEGKPHAVILFYSHRWARPNWCEALGKDLPWGSEERNAAMARGSPPRARAPPASWPAAPDEARRAGF